MGHRWRWELAEIEPGVTQVTETFDYTRSRTPRLLEILGQPGKNAIGITKTLQAATGPFRLTRTARRPGGCPRDARVPCQVNVLKFETLFCRAAADVRLTRSRGTIASSGAWLVPAGTPGIRRRVARTAADPAEVTELLRLLTQFPARFRAVGDARLSARVLSGNPGTQGLDGPVEYGCQALRAGQPLITVRSVRYRSLRGSFTASSLASSWRWSPASSGRPRMRA